MKNNPFSLDFGGTPYLMIPRHIETQKIVNAFSAELPPTHIFMIMGARGNGKTVLMSSVKDELIENTEWLHVDISPESNMLEVLASSLIQKSKKKYSKKKVDFNLDLKIASFGVSSESDSKYSSVYTDLDNIIEYLRDKKTKILITVDEAVNSKSMRELTTYFQHCLREKYPVFLLMTGLYKNIRALQNNRSQTFLKRAPRVILGSLSLIRIAQKYQEVFSLEMKKADEMAKFTEGYSYAFQILGYLVFESKKQEISDSVLNEYKLILGESSYDKIWEELSPNERLVAKTVAEVQDGATVKEVREILNMNSNEFSTYGDTLEKSGVLASDSAYGTVRFALPYIREYIQNK
ncbi:MAG: hypothetical protein IKW90_07050 [Lachnospiraceae bacterium]|nr:hypothetical protein [Lachnospiraceae bacterium]